MNQETEDSASIENFNFLLSVAQRAAGQSLKQKPDNITYTTLWIPQPRTSREQLLQQQNGAFMIPHGVSSKTDLVRDHRIETCKIFNFIKCFFDHIK